ncbi:family 78 glycoside hydrolase catalytic domain [Propioniciclava soli]|uniref:alpha-L-rhamnosidase n=1 Tax=Propioniciclava soli TaxID=2775081 RepID=A0ABZ3C4R5_9ACTN
MICTAPTFEQRSPGEPALGVGTPTPRLTWAVADAPDDVRQASATVKVTRSPWGGEASTETATLDSDAQVLVDWPFVPLASRERAEVRVRVHATDGADSDWSEPAVVEAGLLATSDWGDARLISPVGVGGLDEPAPALVATWELPAGVRAARLHLTAHGWYEVLINGRRVGEDWFGPGWTAYEDRLRYYTHDVTDLLTAGTNTVQILLGNGWWRSPLTWNMERMYGDRLAALARLEVVTDDGATQALGTDDSWVARTTHVTANDLYGGETQDLRRPLIDDADHPVEVVDLDLDTLVAARGPAVRVTEVVDAQRVWRSPAGKLLVDFGQNLVGVTRLTVRGLASGDAVTIRHAEVLEHDELGTRPLRNARATASYTVAGPQETVLAPHFTFFGFRYAEVTGVDELAAEDISALVLHSAMTRTGWFTSSHDLLNQLHENVVWGMRGNFLDVPTDCPQRDERLGWTGDIQVFSPTALILHDAAGFLGSWLEDLAAEQDDSGAVPIVVPHVLRGGLGGRPAAAWGDAASVVPWNVYAATGDAEVLRRQLPSMKAWVDCVAAAAGEDHLWTGDFQFGDWLDPDAPPEKPGDSKVDKDLVATACLVRSARLTADACAAVGDEEGRAHYAGLADAVRTALRNRWITADGLVHSDSPTGYAMAICWDLLDDAQRVFAGARLADLARLNSFRVSTGFVGTPLICQALHDTGHTDVAYRLLLEEGCPSWLYPVTMGATTIWERWDSMLPDGTINPGEMTSFNHYALGAVAEFLHQVVAGLTVDAVARHVELAPAPTHLLEHASSRRLTPWGEASGSWRREGGELIVEATIPVGLRGTVVTPGGERHEVGPGTHRFEVAAPPAPDAPATVRDYVSSDAWPRASAALLEVLPLDDARQIAQGLGAFLDVPVDQLGMALTMGGMFGPAAEVQAVVDASLAPSAS